MRLRQYLAISLVFAVPACAAVGPRGASIELMSIPGAEDVDPQLAELLQLDPVILVMMFSLANQEATAADECLPRHLRPLEPEATIAFECWRMLPPETRASFVEEVRRARAFEPHWNNIHHSWGHFFGAMGLTPERTFDILNDWERFEHHSPIGRGLNLSCGEGPFGYLWDLECGMEGYWAGCGGDDDAPVPTPAGEATRAASAIDDSGAS